MLHMNTDEPQQTIRLTAQTDFGQVDTGTQLCFCKRLSNIIFLLYIYIYIYEVVYQKT